MTHISKYRFSDLPLASPLASLVLIDHVDVVVARLLRRLIHRCDGRLLDRALVVVCLCLCLLAGFQLDIVAIALPAGKPGDALAVASDAGTQARVRVRRPLRRRVQLARDFVPEEVHQRASDGGHACADDADVALDAAPDSNVVVVVCRV